MSASQHPGLDEWRARCPLFVWRRRRRFARADVAALVGVSEQTVRSWENGSRPRAEHMDRLAAQVDDPGLSERWNDWLAVRPGAML